MKLAHRYCGGLVKVQDVVKQHTDPQKDVVKQRIFWEVQVRSFQLPRSLLCRWVVLELAAHQQQLCATSDEALHSIVVRLPGRLHCGWPIHQRSREMRPLPARSSLVAKQNRRRGHQIPPRGWTFRWERPFQCCHGHHGTIRS